MGEAARREALIPSSLPWLRSGFIFAAGRREGGVGRRLNSAAPAASKPLLFVLGDDDKADRIDGLFGDEESNAPENRALKSTEDMPPIDGIEVDIETSPDVSNDCMRYMPARSRVSRSAAASSFRNWCSWLIKSNRAELQALNWLASPRSACGLCADNSFTRGEKGVSIDALSSFDKMHMARDMYPPCPCVTLSESLSVPDLSFADTKNLGTATFAADGPKSVLLAPDLDPCSSVSCGLPRGIETSDRPLVFALPTLESSNGGRMDLRNIHTLVL